MQEPRRYYGSWGLRAGFHQRTRSSILRGYRRVVKVKAVIAMLESDGWAQVRVTGSHRQFHHPSKPGTVTVAGKPNIDLPPGTLNSVLKQAGLKK